MCDYERNCFGDWGWVRVSQHNIYDFIKRVIFGLVLLLQLIGIFVISETGVCESLTVLGLHLIALQVDVGTLDGAIDLG